MTKKNKSHKNFNIELPEIYNMDDIGYMMDETLYDRVGRLESERSKLVSNGYDAKPWEVEVAYVQREQGIRKTRAEMHAEYVRKFQTPFDEIDFGNPNDNSCDSLN